MSWYQRDSNFNSRSYFKKEQDIGSYWHKQNAEKNKSNERYTEVERGAQHSLVHFIFGGGRTYTLDGCADKPEFKRIITKWISDTGIGKHTLFHTGCKSYSQHHAHSIVAVRCDDNGKSLQHNQLLNRRYFKSNGRGSQGCDSCAQLAAKGGSSECKDCGCKLRIIPIKNKEHLNAAIEYLQRRASESNGEDWDTTKAVSQTCLVPHKSDDERYACDVCFSKGANESGEEAENSGDSSPDIKPKRRRIR